MIGTSAAGKVTASLGWISGQGNNIVSSCLHGALSMHNSSEWQCMVSG